PDVLAAEQALLQSIVGSEGTLWADQKSEILHAVAAAWPGGRFGRPPESRTTSSGLAAELLRFALKLSNFGAFVSQHDVDDLTKAGLDDSSVIEAVAAVALGHFFRTLGTGLAIEIQPASIPPVSEPQAPEMAPDNIQSIRSHIQIPALEPQTLT